MVVGDGHPRFQVFGYHDDMVRAVERKPPAVAGITFSFSHFEFTLHMSHKR
jgi:hypothetical protein